MSGDFVVLLTFNSYANPTGCCVECGGGSECCDVSSPVPSHENCPVEDTCDIIGLRYCLRDVRSTGISCPIITINDYQLKESFWTAGWLFFIPNPVPIVGEEPWRVSHNEWWWYCCWTSQSTLLAGSWISPGRMPCSISQGPELMLQLIIATQTLQ